MINISQLEEQIETKLAHVPGLAIAIMQNQEVIYAKGFGFTSKKVADCQLHHKPSSALAQQLKP